MANYDEWARNVSQQVAAAHKMIREMGAVVGDLRGEHAQIRANQAALERTLGVVAQTMESIKVGKSGGASGQAKDYIGPSRGSDYAAVRYIQDIPGRRVPQDVIVQIPFGANVGGTQQGSYTVSQDGPFVAVARSIVFQSALTFTFRDPQTDALGTFQGRSFGRFRPAHSAWDLNDAGAGVFNPIAGLAAPGTGGGIYASPSNHSSFRTMEWDGFIEFRNQGSGWARQNDPVPSAFYTSSINEAFQLGSLDFFERGEVLQWIATPSHLNNPSVGNVNAFAGAGPYPFLGSQYDVHEGILDPLIPGAPDNQADPVTRLPDGFLYILLHGYRIIQPPGPVGMT